tara:strand:- start:112 stop:285 length:174 start_codon:yes stop_codon:yes gene_type:complete
MKAIHKYKKAAKQGNTEAQRRIAQSYGYKVSLADTPLMDDLMNKAGVYNTDGDTIQL